MDDWSKGIAVIGMKARRVRRVVIWKASIRSMVGAPPWLKALLFLLVFKRF